MKKFGSHTLEDTNSAELSVSVRAEEGRRPVTRNQGTRGAFPQTGGYQQMTFGALDNSVIGSHTDTEWRALVRLWKGRCFYCARPICKNSLDPKGELTKDHQLPLSRGGTDFIWNIVPACAHCNKLKGIMTVDEFRAARPGAQKVSCAKEIHISTGESIAENLKAIDEAPLVSIAENREQKHRTVELWVTHSATGQRDNFPAHNADWYEQRRNQLRTQAVNLKRHLAESAGQMTLQFETRKPAGSAGQEEPKCDQTQSR